MKILGPTTEKILVQVIFKIILVLYILLLALKLIANILVENISGASARREAAVDELRWSLTGRSIMDPAQNLKMMSKSSVSNTSNERS